YTGQINPGDSYNKFKKCVSISILDFELFDDTGDFYSCFHIAEDNRHTLYTDKMEFHVLELTKLPEELKDDSDNILLWAKFINAERKEEFDMIADKNPYIESAYQTLQVISQDEEKRLEYEAREKAIRDHNQFMYEARQKGRAEGIKIGEAHGKTLAAIEIAKRLIEQGYSTNEIMLITNLPKNQIDKLY
ncbi:Rpn family recombination-promoting nuclease/putative transposase, partial [bacterium D16-59]